MRFLPRAQAPEACQSSISVALPAGDESLQCGGDQGKLWVLIKDLPALFKILENLKFRRFG